MSQAIVIIGGYNSIWTTYLKMARHLEDLTGLPAVGVPLMPWDWWTAGRAEDASNILQKLKRTVLWARRRFRANRLILVGHSAGGVIARLYLYDQSVWGYQYTGMEHVTAVITLGSPHCSARGAEIPWFVTAEANRLVPGTPYDQVFYRAVVGKYLKGDAQGSYKERRAFRLYQIFDGRGDVWGDGMVPVHCAGLDGADTVIVKNVAHSSKIGSHWYGSRAAIIRRWWPTGIDHHAH